MGCTDTALFLPCLCKEYVNMTADELEEWLKTSDSTGAGWHGSGDAEGETVGEHMQLKLCYDYSNIVRSTLPPRSRQRPPYC